MQRLVEADKAAKLQRAAKGEMSMVTLHEAIELAREVSRCGCTECHKEHRQLADWLEELERSRAELANCKQELWQIKYCYDIAKNGEKQLRKQNDEITAAWAECEKKLKQVTAERDAAIKSRAELAEYELTVCEEFCYGDAQHDIPPCEWLIDGKCALREWVKAND